jgi:uncharacterized protein (TIGR03437 family)
MGSRHSWLYALLIVSAVSAQTLDNRSLTGKYYFRHLFAATDAVGNITEVRSLLGAITFDGGGAYILAGQQNVGSAAASAFSSSGAYTMNPAGIVSLTNPLRPALSLNARFSALALIGSSTESTDNVFDLFIAIPAPSGGVSNASLTGSYWATGLEINAASASRARSSFFPLNSLGSGAFTNAQISGHNAAQSGGSPYSETISNARYMLNSDGTGSANFPNSTLVADNKTLYISRDGNVILAGSTTAGAHDLLVAIKQTLGPASNATWKDKFWSAGLRIDLRNLSAFSGSTASNAAGKLLVTRRVHAIGATPANGAIDFTGVNPYSLNADGSGAVLAARVALGADGNAFVAAGGLISETTAYELYLGARMPPLSGSGVFLDPQGVVNTASFAPAGSPIAPGEFAALYGSGLAPSLQVATTTTFPATLGGVSVTMNNLPAPLYFVSGTQIAALVPFNLQGQRATIVVDNNGAKSNPVDVPIAPTAPGIFSLDKNGIGPGAILHPDFRVVTAGSPAKRGETIQVYLTGLGPVAPTIADGAPGRGAEPFNRTTQTPKVHIGSKVGTVTYSGLAPGLPGLYQLNVVIPNDAPTGSAIPLAIETVEHFHDQVDVAITP